MKKLTVYLVTGLDGLAPRVIGSQEAARRLGLTPTHIRRIVLGERTRTPAFDRAVTIKEIVNHG